MKVPQVYAIKCCPINRTWFLCHMDIFYNKYHPIFQYNKVFIYSFISILLQQTMFVMELLINLEIYSNFIAGQT